MKDSNKDDVINLNEIFILLAKGLAIFILLMISLRIPVLWIKIPLTFAVLILGWRWMFRAKKKVASSKTSGASQVKRLAASSASVVVDETEKAGAEDGDAVRALVALDAAGEFGKAKSLIQQLNGEEFSESVGKELVVVAANYFPVELEPTENGVRFKLA
tara:strand:- start:693 stop:1172 length:480 start_codon:yes stop_codon:yes gene_type:complete